MSEAFRIFEEVQDILSTNLAEDNAEIFVSILDAIVEDIENNRFSNNREEITSQIQNILLTFQNIVAEPQFLSNLSQLSSSLSSFTHSSLINLIQEQINIHINPQDTASESSEDYNNDALFQMDDEEEQHFTIAATTHSNSTRQDSGSGMLAAFQRVRADSNIAIFENQMSGSYGSGIEDMFDMLGKNYHYDREGDGTI